ncbi:hypothetical protein C7999DRAFT_36136 [Corynascus novoguineensis]|uniref:Uncharacterized protein n=1 Tax=Corynascus novoguineensis TaxID=1126955 RepID=A0AAN7CK06_9PEZI|nr:hypothetical protein C7999DRAFT_36136 [Corynascus novoguineensis]
MTADAVTLVKTRGATIVTPDCQTTRELYGRTPDPIWPLVDLGACGAPYNPPDRVACHVTSTMGSVARHVDAAVKDEYVNVGEFPGTSGICQGVITDPREPIGDCPAWTSGKPWLRSYNTV